MLQYNKIIQGLGIPFSAFVSIILGLMMLSFPIGVFLVFNSELGENITSEYPVDLSYVFLMGTDTESLIKFELGDIFIIFWCIFLILFAIGIVGPKLSFFRTLAPIMTEGKKIVESNYLVSTITWFSILIVFSFIINYVQEGIGIITEPPIPDNKLLQFFDITKAPIIEEIGFRILLIGIPLFLIYSHKSSFKHFFKSLWRPNHYLHIYEIKNPLILITIVAVFFGLAHIIFGESWSNGKFLQAAISGGIIGWVYFRHGLAPAILIHWATNYFIFAYVFFVAEINEISVQIAFSHSMINTLEILFILTGIISMSILVISKISTKQEEVKDLGQF